MKYLKTFEQFDSPELKGTFTPKDIKGLVKADSPWNGKGPYRQFQYGSIGGDKPSFILNDLIDKGKYKSSDYGISDYLYRLMVKNIPDLKTFQFENYDSFEDGKIGFHLSKKVKLEGTRFNAESEIWIYYHSKSDKILDYDKGKISLLSICGLRPAKRWFGPMDKPENDEDIQAKQAFTDMLKPSDEPSCKSCGGEGEVDIDNDKFDGFLSALSNVLSGHPDKEDEALYHKLEIHFKNLSVKRFEVVLKSVKKNLDFYKKYLDTKYQLKF